MSNTDKQKFYIKGYSYLSIQELSNRGSKAGFTTGLGKFFDQSQTSYKCFETQTGAMKPNVKNNPLVSMSGTQSLTSCYLHFAPSLNRRMSSQMLGQLQILRQDHDMLCVNGTWVNIIQ